MRGEKMLGRILSAMVLAAIITFFTWLVLGSGHEEQLRQVMLVSSLAIFLLGIFVEIVKA
jgi:hypothetical protein